MCFNHTITTFKVTMNGVLHILQMKFDNNFISNFQFPPPPNELTYLWSSWIHPGWSDSPPAAIHPMFC